MKPSAADEDDCEDTAAPRSSQVIMSYLVMCSAYEIMAAKAIKLARCGLRRATGRPRRVQT